MSTHRTERGQALVLILLAIVGIFGFSALAVDVGKIYAERRRAQSAADAAALAAAFDYTQTRNRGHALQAGMDTVLLNGFNNDGTNNTVIINNPPVGGPYDGSGFENYYQVIIWEHIDPIFSQFVFSGDEGVTTEAVSRYYIYTGVSSGNIIHALSEDPDALTMDGTTTVIVDNGNIFSNGGGIKHGESGKIRAYHGKLLIAEDHGWVCTGCKADTVLPKPIDMGVEPQFLPPVPQPYCPAANQKIGGVSYYVHNGISGSETLQPGVHCISGDIVLNGKDVLKGEGVLLVMLNGGIKINGNAKLDLTRPVSLIDKNGNQYGGMLLYAPPTNTSTFTLTGTSDSFFQGTILAPGGYCDIGGTSKADGLHTSLICNKVNFHGTTRVHLVYREAENFRMPSMVELAQ